MQGSAHAQAHDVDARLEARKLGEEGLAHFDAGRWDMALRKLTEADAMLPATTLRLYAARSLAALGRLVEAERRYRSAAELTVPAYGNAVLVRAQNEAARERAALLLEIPTLTIDVEGAAEVRSVRLDDRTVSFSESAAPYLLDPGPHQVEITVANGAQSSRQIVLARRDRRRETFTFSSVDAAALPRTTAEDAEDATPRDATEGDEDRTTQRTLGFVSLGVGGAGLALWGIAGGLAIAEASDNGCEGAACPVPDGELGGARGLRTASTIGFFTGAGFAALGAVLVFTAPSREPDRTEVRATIRPGGLFAEGSF